MFDTCATQEQFNVLLHQLSDEGFFDTLPSLPILDDEVLAFAGQSARYAGWMRNNAKWDIPMRYKVSVNKMLHNEELRTIMWPAFDLTPSDLNNENRHISEMLKEIADFPPHVATLTNTNVSKPNGHVSPEGVPTSVSLVPSDNPARAPQSGSLTTTQLKHRHSNDAADMSLAKSISSFNSNGTVIHDMAESASQHGNVAERLTSSTIMSKSLADHSAVNEPTASLTVSQTRDQSPTLLQQRVTDQSSSILRPQATYPLAHSATTRLIMPLRLKHNTAQTISSTASPPAEL